MAEEQNSTQFEHIRERPEYIWPGDDLAMVITACDYFLQALRIHAPDVIAALNSEPYSAVASILRDQAPNNFQIGEWCRDEASLERDQERRSHVPALHAWARDFNIDCIWVKEVVLRTLQTWYAIRTTTPDFDPVHDATWQWMRQAHFIEVPTADREHPASTHASFQAAAAALYWKVDPSIIPSTFEGRKRLLDDMAEKRSSPEDIAKGRGLRFDMPDDPEYEIEPPHYDPWFTSRAAFRLKVKAYIEHRDRLAEKRGMVRSTHKTQMDHFAWLVHVRVQGYRPICVAEAYSKLDTYAKSDEHTGLTDQAVRAQVATLSKLLDLPPQDSPRGPRSRAEKARAKKLAETIKGKFELTGNL
jgi:hypothetical protein